ncbi:hypothetical protein [Pedobacter alpinus]|uniref:Outer membrane protein beta-barrel domain-containing protein n=1 Tax=Pedobacter alpinus TaxID=1590643 RepID=A0ABW5TX05_9SPHI
MMNRFLTTLFILSISITASFGQSLTKTKSDFKLFNRTSIGYTFGLNETFADKKVNALHIKTVIGFTLPQVGFGIGLETGTFNTVGAGSNSRFNTIAFTGNLHLMAKPNTDESLNYFVKGGAGYAPRIFNSYDKGFTYEAATGVIITTKKNNKYFIETKYHYQEFSRFNINTGKLEVKSLGLGIGTWF